MDSIQQSTWAMASASRGAPVAPALHATPSNLGPPVLANQALSSRWFSPRTLIVHAPVPRIRGHDVELRPGQKSTSGGSSKSEAGCHHVALSHQRLSEASRSSGKIASWYLNGPGYV